MTDTAILVRQVHKVYPGLRNRVHALKGVSLDIPDNSVFGLLGANGAGKTTLLKLMLGLMRPTDGAIRVYGDSVSHFGGRRSFGYLPENHKFPQYMTGRDVLEIYAGLSGVPLREAKQRTPEVLASVGLKPEVLKMRVKKYSKGMQQRLGLAQALISDPRILFLDEPTDGVDPVGRREIRDLLASLKGRGKTIFLNSHLLSEVEMICDRVAILNNGVLTWTGTVEEIHSRAATMSFFTSIPPEEVWRTLTERFGAPRWIGDHFDLDIADPEAVSVTIDLLRAGGVSIYEVVKRRQSLEDFFIQTVGNGKGRFVGSQEVRQ